MLQAVLFDLDGTLLDVDLDGFLRRYFGALKAFAGPFFPGVDMLETVLSGTRAMQQPHDGITNLETFARVFTDRTGVGFDEAWRLAFEDFYREVFPGLGAEYGPSKGAREAIEAARARGLKIVVATQPIFPRIAVEHRLTWAGLGDVEFDAVTTYEVMTACKPRPGYFLQTASMIGCDPRKCLMVGDDRDNDMPGSATGMLTYYVGPDPEARSDYRGPLTALPALLERLAAADVSG